MPNSMAKRVQPKPGPLTPEEKRVLAAQEANFTAESDLLREKTRGESLTNEQKALALEEIRRNADMMRNVDLNHRIYDFDEPVTPNSVSNCISALSVWYRQNDTPIVIKFNSPGGGVLEGFNLFDYIRSIAARDKNGALLGPDADPSSKVSGVYVTTITMGMAASMAGVLLQAGNRRVVAPNAWVLVHDIKSGAMGSIGQMKDGVRIAEKLQTRLHEILTERAKVSKQKLKTITNRKEYWMDAGEAIKLGLADTEGYK